MTEPIYLGLGGNLTEPGRRRRDFLRSGLAALNAATGVKVNRVSSLYQTDPVGPQDQDRFLNCAAEIETSLNPLDLLDLCQAIEHEHHRVRTIKWGPRTLDLDLLLWGTRIVDEERLIIPHPEMINREFVLAPLAELAGEAVHPILNQPIERLLAGLPIRGGIEILEEGGAWSGY